MTRYKSSNNDNDVIKFLPSYSHEDLLIYAINLTRYYDERKEDIVNLTSINNDLNKRISLLMTNNHKLT